ncbi:hypothetical protein D3C72_1057550 [compost metagenome]
MAVPIELPAPAVLSTMIVVPSVFCSDSARSRATRSVGPPAEKGTTSVTGLPAGKSWACAPTAAAAIAARANSFFMMSPTEFLNGKGRDLIG